MTKTRRYCSAQQKVAIAISAIKENLTQAQLTGKYGVHVSQIKIWKQDQKQPNVKPYYLMSSQTLNFLCIKIL